MIYVFCGAYKPLLFALYLKSLGKKITIVTCNKDIIKYCTAENIDYIKFEFVKPKVTSLYTALKLKKVLDEVLEKIDLGKDDKFFLTCVVKGIGQFYLAKKLSKRGIGYYKITDGRFETFKPPRFKPFFIRGGIMRIALKLVLGLDLIYYKGSANNPIFGINENSLKKYNIKEYAPDTPAEDIISNAVKNYKSNQKEGKKYSNFVIDQGSLVKYINFESLKKLYNQLFNLPTDFVYKRHPKALKMQMKKFELSFYNLYKNCDEIPSYIPAELCYHNVKKNVISIFSAGLIPISQLKQLKAIALLELVDWYDESYKKEWRERLTRESKNKILFPNSFEELKEILLNS